MTGSKRTGKTGGGGTCRLSTERLGLFRGSSGTPSETRDFRRKLPYPLGLLSADSVSSGYGKLRFVPSILGQFWDSRYGRFRGTAGQRRIGGKALRCLWVSTHAGPWTRARIRAQAHDGRGPRSYGKCRGKCTGWPAEAIMSWICCSTQACSTRHDEQEWSGMKMKRKTRYGQAVGRFSSRQARKGRTRVRVQGNRQRGR